MGTYLYGRRMYETMRFWETAHTLPDLTPVARAYADIWRAADRVVFSETQAGLSSERTRVERVFDPDLVRQLPRANSWLGA